MNEICSACVRDGAFLLLFAVAACIAAPPDAPPPTAARDPSIEGFASLLHAPHATRYPFFKGIANAALLYANPVAANVPQVLRSPNAAPDNAIDWVSAPLPNDATPNTATFTWAVAMSGADNPVIREAPPDTRLPMRLLLLSNQDTPSQCAPSAAVPFALGVAGHMVWTGRVSGLSLEFNPLLRDQYQDLSGLMRLTVPRSLLVPGQPLRLRVLPDAQPDIKAFFMLFLDTAVAAYQPLWPDAVAKSRTWRRHDEPHPCLAGYDAGAHLHIANADQAETARQRIIRCLWPSGALPTNALPLAKDLLPPDADGQAAHRRWRFAGDTTRQPQSDAANNTLRFIENSLVARAEWLEFPMDFGYSQYGALLRPLSEPTPPRLLVLHHGHGVAEPGHGIYETTDWALGHGMSVLMLHMPLVGWNTNRVLRTPEGQTITVTGHGTEGHDNLVPALEGMPGSPLRFFLEPVIAGINHFLARHADALDISMVGLSGGGWTTHLAAAVDPRIRTSIAAAGSYPLYLRRLYPGAEGDAEQEWAPLFVHTASWLDVYVLSGHGNGRHAVQLLNRYDPYFYGVGHETYSPLVARTVDSIGGGHWACVLDDTHKGHIISAWAVKNVVAPALTTP